MFLDPDPKRQKQTMSGFAAPQTPVASPRDARLAVTKRRPLQERTKSQNNAPGLTTNPARTVRLVPPSPTPSGPISSDNEDFGGKENRRRMPQGKVARLLPQFDVAKDVSASKAALQPVGGYDVSNPSKSTTKALKADLLDTVTLHHAGQKGKDVDASRQTMREASDAYSQSSTLHVDDTDGSIELDDSHDRRQRISEGTTLSGSPSPEDAKDHEVIMGLPRIDDIQEDLDEQMDSTSDPLSPNVQIINSDSSESAADTVLDVRTTLRNVSASSPVAQGGLTPTHAMFPRPLRHRGSSDSYVGSVSPLSNDDRRSSLGGASNANVRRPGAALGFYSSRESLPSSEISFAATSSPNFVAFSSSPTRARSQSHPLNYARSFDSIDTRLERTPSFRPGTGRSLATNHSVFTTSSNDTLPPLAVPKKRLRHMPGSSSLNAQHKASSASLSEDYHSGPYLRHHFSNNLSTIASESDRTSSQQLSHFSLGSGVSTGDEYSLPPSATWMNPSQESIPEEPRTPRPGTGIGGDDEPGDMTLGIYREPSLIPQPLFKESLPPVPPMHAYIHPGIHSDHDERIDTLSALQAPPLRQKRSGYSMRQRSNSTPSQFSHATQASQVSHNESERWSYGSVIFPTWARHYYSGAAMLSHKISMSSIGTTRVRPGLHSRHGSVWTERSAVSRVNTSHTTASSAATPRFESPASSAFLPSIFRPRTRPRQKRETPVRSGRFRHFSRSESISPESRDESETATMRIQPDPVAFEVDEDEILPSGQPRWGELKDDTPSHKPLPRAYTRQKEWSSMQFPREMSQEDLARYVIPHPHLVPSRRQSRPSTWRPPSFVESLDTLIHSRSNRQILLFAFGFLCPLLWMIGAVLPIPNPPLSDEELGMPPSNTLEDDIERERIKQEVCEAQTRWHDEQVYLRGRWWRMLNRVMSVVGFLVIGAVIALAIVATR